MALKTFDELRKIEVPTKKLDGGFDYLNWLDCLDCLRENGAEDIQYDCETITGLRIDTQGNSNAVVKVYVEIDGKRRHITHPVAFGEFSIQNPTARQIETAIHRGMVKCVAINWGLGLDLWKKYETDAAPMPTDNNLPIRLAIEFGKRVSMFDPAIPDTLHGILGTTKASFDKLLKQGSKEDQQAMLEKILALDKTDAF